MGKIILHIGTHKTATTSIQRTLRYNDRDLRERGVFYPNYEIIGKKKHYAHLGVVNAYSGQHPSMSKSDATRFFEEVRRRAESFDLTILSAEPFYRHVSGGDQPQSLEKDQYWEKRKEYIEEIKKVTGANNVVMTFREQKSYAVSLYQEHIKATRYKGNFSDFLKDFWFHFCFLDQAKAWRSSFPKAKVLSFDRLREGRGVVANFFEEIGLGEVKNTQGRISNEGYPVDFVILKRVLHSGSSEKDEIRRRLDKILENLSDEEKEHLKLRSFFSSKDDEISWQQKFDGDNAELCSFLPEGKRDSRGFFLQGKDKNLTYGDNLHWRAIDIILRSRDPNKAREN